MMQQPQRWTKPTAQRLYTAARHTGFGQANGRNQHCPSASGLCTIAPPPGLDSPDCTSAAELSQVGGDCVVRGLIRATTAMRKLRVRSEPQSEMISVTISRVAPMRQVDSAQWTRRASGGLSATAGQKGRTAAKAVRFDYSKASVNTHVHAKSEPKPDGRDYNPTGLHHTPLAQVRPPPNSGTVCPCVCVELCEFD